MGIQNCIFSHQFCKLVICPWLYLLDRASSSVTKCKLTLANDQTKFVACMIVIFSFYFYQRLIDLESLWFAHTRQNSNELMTAPCDTKFLATLSHQTRCSALSVATILGNLPRTLFYTIKILHRGIQFQRILIHIRPGPTSNFASLKSPESPKSQNSEIPTENPTIESRLQVGSKPTTCVIFVELRMGLSVDLWQLD